MYKIIIDTNLWISYLIGKKVQNLRELCFYKDISVITCQRIIEEFVDVSSRAHIKKYVDTLDIIEAIDLIKEFCVDVPLEKVYVPELQDLDDSFLFALSEAMGANFILTGDKGLLALKSYKETKIASYSEFVKWYFSSD